MPRVNVSGQSKKLGPSYTENKVVIASHISLVTNCSCRILNFAVACLDGEVEPRPSTNNVSSDKRVHFSGILVKLHRFGQNTSVSSYLFLPTSHSCPFFAYHFVSYVPWSRRTSFALLHLVAHPVLLEYLVKLPTRNRLLVGNASHHISSTEVYITSWISMKKTSSTVSSSSVHQIFLLSPVP